MLDLEPTEPFSLSFKELGFESRYMLNNLGTMLIFYALYPVSMLLQLFLSRCCRCIHCFDRIRKKLKHMLYFKMIITVVFESYAIVALSCIVGLQNLNYGSAGLKVQLWSCIVFTVFIFLFPALILGYLSRNFANLHDKRIKKRFGTLYSELNVRKGARIFVQPSFFILRRLILVFAIVHFNKYLVGQILLI